MATTINAATTGLVETSDGTAVLDLQTGGVTAIRVNATQAIGVGSTPSFGTAGQFLTSQGSGASPTWTSGGSGTVTSVSWTGGIVSVATATTTPAFTIAGTSGGIPYFSSASTWASSAALTQYGVVYGGGAGAAPVATAAGTTGQFLGANTGGAPTWQTPAGGGSPGGSTTQVQYNNAGAFGGISQMTYNGTTVAVSNDMTISGLTVGKGVGGTSTNTAVGNGALGGSAAGGGNTAFGNQALNVVNNAATTGNTAVGNQSLVSLTSGVNNVAIGASSGNNTTTGSNNCFIGGAAGYDITTGSYNIYLGYNPRPSGVSVTNELVVSCNSGSTLTGKGANTGYIYVGAAGSVYQGNNGASWAITSDQRIKKNIVNLSDSLSKINALRVVEFDYKENDKHDIGFIAQEFEQHFPEQIIRHKPNDVEKEWVGEDEVMGIQHNLIPFLVKAIQELTARIAVLEAK